MTAEEAPLTITDVSDLMSDFSAGYLHALATEQHAITRAVIAARTPRVPALPVPVRPVRLRLVVEDPWRVRANCLGVEPELFYPGPWDQEARELALGVCSGCVVRAKCLDWALEHNETFGVWGGTTERQRSRLRRQLPRWARCRGCGDRYRKEKPAQRYCEPSCRAISVKYRREVAAHPERRRPSRSRQAAS